MPVHQKQALDLGEGVSLLVERASAQEGAPEEFADWARILVANVAKHPWRLFEDKYQRQARRDARESLAAYRKALLEIVSPLWKAHPDASDADITRLTAARIGEDAAKPGASVAVHRLARDFRDPEQVEILRPQPTVTTFGHPIGWFHHSMM